MKSVLVVGASLLLVFGLVLGSTVVAYGWAWWSAPYRGKLEARQTINSGSNRIAQYDKFFTLCADVKTFKSYIKTFEEELKLETNPQDIRRIRDNLLGARGRVNEIVNVYNAASSADYTQGQFKASNLPYRLTVAGETDCERYVD